MQLDGSPVSTAQLGALGLVNYGHFTTMRVENGRVRGLDRHLERLVRDCRVLFGVDLDLARVRELVRRAVDAAVGEGRPVAGDAPDGTVAAGRPVDGDAPGTVRAPVLVRVTVYDPALGMAHPGADAQPRILTSTRGVNTDNASPVRLATTAYQRELPQIKHVGLFGAVHHRRTAQRAGFDDVLFVAPDGAVSEGATWNFGVIRDGRVCWPAAGCLPGVTMGLLSAELPIAGIGVRRERITPGDLDGTCTAFITNAAVGVRPVHSVDGVRLAGDRAVLDRLRAVYERIVGQPL